VKFVISCNHKCKVADSSGTLTSVCSIAKFSVLFAFW